MPASLHPPTASRSEFFSNFKPMKKWSREDVEKRVVTNFLQYRTNYLLLVMGVVCLSIITSPALIFVLLVCAGIWVRWCDEMAGVVAD